MIQNPPWQIYKNYVVHGFNSSDLLSFKQQWPKTPLSVFTEKEFDFQHYGPSMFWAINNQRGTNFPINKAHLRRQYEGDIIAQFATLEGAVRNKYYHQEGWIDSKARALCKLGNISKDLNENLTFVFNPNHTTPKNLAKTFDVYLPSELSCIGLGYSPNWIQNISDKRNWVYQLKQVYSQLIKNQKICDPAPKVLSKSQKRSESGLVNMLKENFGQNIGVVLYGSATYSSNAFNDYDALVLVDEILPKHYEILENKEINFNSKDVDVVFLRKSDWENYVLMNPFSLGIVKKGVILEGNFEFPAIDETHAVLRVMSRACGRMRTLHNIALNWAHDNYNELKERQGLLKSLSKIPRYILGACLQLKDLNQNLTHTQHENSALDEMLKSIKINREEFKDSTQIQQDLFKIMQDTAEIIELFYEPQWIHSYKSEIKLLNSVSKSLEERFKEERKQIEKQKEFNFANQPS